MYAQVSGRWISAIFLVVLLEVIPAQARPQSEAPGTIPVTTVVTALGSKFTAPPAISKDDVTIREGKVRRDITNWIPAQGDRAGLQLAIVIDDSLQKIFRESDSGSKRFYHFAAQVNQRWRILRRQWDDSARVAVQPGFRGCCENASAADGHLWRRVEHLSIPVAVNRRLAGYGGAP